MTADLRPHQSELAEHALNVFDVRNATARAKPEHGDTLGDSLRTVRDVDGREINQPLATTATEMAPTMGHLERDRAVLLSAFDFCGCFERFHDVSAHPRTHQGLQERRSEPVRPLQANRRRQPVAHAIPLTDEFVRERRLVTFLELSEVDTRCRDITQDVDDAALDVIDLDHRRVPIPLHDARGSDRCGEEAYPVVRFPIQRANAVWGRVHVLADGGMNLPE